ncbi:hypothetical protein SLI_4931 [Streptomyces lividans 1326]|uniref:Glycosyltransferase 2-like domain-containing protein n=1 Tax=Streptomyces lividans 1326 TaxID=1200984 RepID=A0A7U9DT77_STRLI|nr:hypothetical protein SLI_4931 [Streptomyces lividans 1326]
MPEGRDAERHAPVVLSVVIPMFNEEDVLPALVTRLRPVLTELGVPHEVVAVDDGSGDRTAELLDAFRLGWPELRVVALRRNSGHQAALTAGLDRARGAYVVSLDADLQDPPEKIPDMLALARAEGLDIVYGVRADRSSDSGFKRWTAGVYYRLMRRLAGPSVPAQAGDFRLLSRAARGGPQGPARPAAGVPAAGALAGLPERAGDVRARAAYGGPHEVPAGPDDPPGGGQRHRLLRGPAAHRHLAGRRRLRGLPGAAGLHADRVRPGPHGARLDLAVHRHRLHRRRAAGLCRPAGRVCRAHIHGGAEPAHLLRPPRHGGDRTRARPRARPAPAPPTRSPNRTKWDRAGGDAGVAHLF